MLASDGSVYLLNRVFGSCFLMREGVHAGLSPMQSPGTTPSVTATALRQAAAAPASSQVCPNSLLRVGCKQPDSGCLQ